MTRAWRGWLLGLAATAAVALAAPEARAQGCGDVNNSGGAVTGSDCQLIARAAVGLGTPGALCNGMGVVSCGDMDGSGTAGLGDALVCLRVLNGLATLFTPCTSQGALVACGTNRQGNITTNEVWQNCGGATSVTLTGPTFIQPGVTVTVQPGALVEANPGSNATIIVQRDARLNANGTAANPIVFTSNSPPKATGDWGGIVMNGRAQANCGGNCFAEGFDPMDNVVFGGINDNDTSGVLRFVRIEFSGIEFSENNELNVLTMNGVGRQTQLDHVQAHRGDDDCLEWFGGAVDGKFLVADGCLDDLVDAQLGWRGRIQFVLAIQGPGLDGGDRHSFEWDNNETGFDNSPVGNPKVCNATSVGTLNDGDIADPMNVKEGARLRRGTAGNVSNSIFSDFVFAGLRIVDTDTCQNVYQGFPTCTLKTAGDVLVVQDSILFGNTTDFSPSCAPCNPSADWTANRGLQVGTDPGYNVANPTYPAGLDEAGADRYVPTVGSAADNVNEDCSVDDGGKPVDLADPFFTSAPYAGAFAPNATPANGNWLRDSTTWISFALN